MLTQINFQGADGWALENDRVRAVVLPGHGGKVVSLRYVPNGFEFLPTLRPAALTTPFRRWTLPMWR